MKVEITGKVGSGIGKVEEVWIGCPSRESTPDQEKEDWVEIRYNLEVKIVAPE